MGILRRYESTLYGNFRKEGVKAGLWSGGLLVVYLLVRWLANAPPDAPQTYFSDLILFGCMLMQSYLYRRNLPKQRVTLRELMQMNLWLCVVAATIFGLFTWLYGSAIDGDFVSRCVQRLIDDELAGNNVDEQKRQVVEVMKGYRAATLAWIAAFRTFVMGILWAFLSALLFHNEKGKVVGTGLFEKKRS